MMKYEVLDVLETETAYLSSQELARATGATKSQILHWGKTGYIPRRKEGYHMFPIQVLPKARIMAVLVREAGLEPSRASGLAERLLERFKDAPDSARAVIGFLKLLYEHLDEVVDFVGEDKQFRDCVAAIEKESAEISEEGEAP